MKATTSGFSLLELIICTLIISLLCATAAPELSTFVENQRIQSHTYAIWRLLAKTRALAVISGKRMSVCGLNSNSKCSLHDIKQLVIYDDINQNHGLDPDDKAIEYLDLSPEIKVQFGFGGRGKSMYYKSDGYPSQRGGVTICPSAKSPTLTQKITINKDGRLYLTPDRNGDGYIEDSRGGIIKCKI